jgi:Helix-turn-helix domain
VEAYALGYSHSDLSRWENGEKTLDLVEVENLAALYDLSLADSSTVGMVIQHEDARTGAPDFGSALSRKSIA